MRALAIFPLALAVALSAAPALAQGGPDGEIEPVVEFAGPHLRLGVHLEAGALLASAWGLYGGVETLIGVRLTTELSLVARVQLDLGGWDRQGLDLLTSVAGGAGVEYTAFGVFGAGTALSAGLTGGVYLPDACEASACAFFAPMGVAHLAYFFGSGYTPTNPLAAFSVGVTGGVGYDVTLNEAAGRVTLYFGYELSIN